MSSSLGMFISDAVTVAIPGERETKLEGCAEGKLRENAMESCEKSTNFPDERKRAESVIDANDCLTVSSFGMTLHHGKT